MSNRSGRQSALQKQTGAKPKQGQRPQQQSQQKQQQRAQQSKQQQARTGAATLTTDSQVVTAERQSVAARQQERTQARQERQASARAEAARRKRMRTLKRTAILSAIVVVLVGVTSWLIIREAGKPGRLVDMMVSTHVAGESGITYNTDPPTSGPHVGAVPAFTVYSQPITKELTIHGLEDAGVIINYVPGTDQATIDKLRVIAESYQNLPRPKSHVVMAPYPDKFRDNPNATIALTAWRRIDLLDTFDEQRIRRFIDEYVGIDHHGESGS